MGYLVRAYEVLAKPYIRVRKTYTPKTAYGQELEISAPGKVQFGCFFTSNKYINVYLNRLWQKKIYDFKVFSNHRRQLWPPKL